MTKEYLYNFISKHKFAVLSTVSEENKPESAVVGIAVTKDLKIFFDTVSTSRKYQNLLKIPSIAFVIGWDDARTVQYEEWKDIAYFCVEPKWIRYSDFTIPQYIEELTF
ncbi:MAG: pyridoxamine 5'-phosphate oxidase family protein [Bacteroidetes bacterium]|nr:pyridoxamine 5'-phosphate oxidase family protein [Bacteroidota bacterium]